MHEPAPPCRVLVLGGSSGIGLLFSALVSEESSVELVVTAPSAEAAAETRDQLGPQVEVQVVDLLDVSKQQLAKPTAATDVLVLSAGLEYVGPAELEPPGAFEQMLAVNAAGPMLAARCCLPGMIKRGRGLIVGLGSIVTSGPRPFLAGYTASKAALGLYLESLAREVDDTGVRIEHLRLGPVATNLGSHGPMNWAPDAGSPYHDAYLAARAESERERAALERSPTAVAEEILDLVRAHRSSQL